MMISSATTGTQARPEAVPVSTVALCHVDPDRFVMPPQGMAGVSGTSLLTVYGCPEAIEAALRGEVDVLVVDADRVGLAGLNALSFLSQERPDVPLYLFHDDGSGPPRLIAWDSLV